MEQNLPCFALPSFQALPLWNGNGHPRPVSCNLAGASGPQLEGTLLRDEPHLKYTLHLTYTGLQSQS